MIATRAPAESSRPSHPRPPLWLSLWTAAPFMLLAGFVATFNPVVNSWAVNSLWFAAIALWWLRFRGDRPAARAPKPSNQGWWAFAALAIVFGATWLPFYDNWRWVQAGDTLGFFGVPKSAVERGLPMSLLSMHGIDEHLAFMCSVADNLLMFVFGPTFFWHRASKFVVSAGALLSVHFFFSQVLEFPWPSAIVVITAVTFNWLNMSHISVTLTDSLIFAYLALAMLTRVLRQPERLSHWVTLGIVSGCSLFFSQTAWCEVIASGLVVSCWALTHHRTKQLLLCGLSFLIVSAPAFLQIKTLLLMATSQTRMQWDWAYLSHIFYAILWLPAGRSWADVAWNGSFAGWPCGYFYLTGLAIAGLCALSSVRRRLHLPIATVGLLALFLAEVATMALTNNLNSSPSPKRTEHLVPLQAFFGLLPFYTVARARARTLLRNLATAAAGLAVAAYVIASASLFIFPQRFGFGCNLFDALVQMHQRFPNRKIVAFVTQPNIKTEIDDPSSVFNTIYHVSDNLAITRSVDPAIISAACAAQTIICHHNRPEDREALVHAAAEQHLRRIDVYATAEMRCFECM